MAAGRRLGYPCGVIADAFLERESLELRRIQAFLERESPACEVVLASSAAQAVTLALRRKARPRVLVVQGGLGDGRARDLVDRLTAETGVVERVLFVDHRHLRGELVERSAEALEAEFKPSLAEGWLLVRFLDRR
jgi:DNA-binding NarL/FixJ family response regulator